MDRTEIRQLPAQVGESVRVAGWVATTRSSGKIAFVVIRDGSGYLQCVVSKREVPEPIWVTVAELTQEASVAVTGDGPGRCPLARRGRADGRGPRAARP